ncbi:hypothetical protein F4810DRAFT_663504 [Camillea tinctor]|nr:hypothetical protein F4810DRAFT_663504 [Camillea tinctor]
MLYSFTLSPSFFFFLFLCFLSDVLTPTVSPRTCEPIPRLPTRDSPSRVSPGSYKIPRHFCLSHCLFSPHTPYPILPLCRRAAASRPAADINHLTYFHLIISSAVLIKERVSHTQMHGDE